MYDLTNTALGYNLQHFFEVKLAPLTPSDKLSDLVQEIERIGDHHEKNYDIPSPTPENRLVISDLYLDVVATHIEGMYPLLYLPGDRNVEEIKGVKKSEQLQGEYVIGLGLVGSGLIRGFRIGPYLDDVKAMVSSLGLEQFPHKLTTYCHTDSSRHEAVIGKQKSKNGFKVKAVPKGMVRFFKDYFPVHHYYYATLEVMVSFPSFETLSETTLKHQSLPKVREVSALYRKWNKGKE